MTSLTLGARMSSEMNMHCQNHTHIRISTATSERMKRYDHGLRLRSPFMMVRSSPDPPTLSSTNPSGVSCGSLSSIIVAALLTGTAAKPGADPKLSQTV